MGINSQRIFEIRADSFEKNAPSYWELIKFEDVCDVTDYVANGSFASLKQNVHYKRERDFAVLVRYTDHANKWSGNYVYVDKNAYNFLRKSSLHPGDIIIANVGDPGKVFQVPNLRQPMTLGPNSVLVRPHGYIDKGFIAKLFESAWGQDLINRITTGTAQRKFNKTGLRSTIIPIAPLNEQKRIVDKIELLFSDLDEGEELLKTVQKQLATYRQSVLKAAVTGELTKDWREQNKHRLEPGEKLLERILKSRRENWKGRRTYNESEKIDSPYFNIPIEWGLTTLDMISHRVTDGTHQSPKFEDSGIPFVVIGDVRGGYIDWDSVSKWVSKKTYEENTKRCRPEKDDILYTAVGTYGIALKVKDDKEFMFQRHIAHIKPIRGFIFTDFIVAALNSPLTLSHAHKVARGVAQKTVTLGELNRFQIPIPSIDEQKEIVDRIVDIFSRIDALENWCATELKRSATFRQSILKAAFSGKLVPQDPSDEPAGELLKRIQASRTTIRSPRHLKHKKPGIGV